MPHHHQAASEFPVWITLTIIFMSFVYLRGWRRLHSTSMCPVPAWRSASFFIGLFLIWVTVASPVRALDHQLLTAHMIQHLLLMTFAAPLILLGEPAMLLLDGLPGRFVRIIIDPLFRSPLVHQLGKALTQPAFCWLAATTVLVGWHVPAVFTLGMKSETWHAVEQAFFLGS